VLELVFREHGLPRVIRSDNGAPFASLGAGGLSRLGGGGSSCGLHLDLHLPYPNRERTFPIE
jgi:putative transposase